MFVVVHKERNKPAVAMLHTDSADDAAKYVESWGPAVPGDLTVEDGQELYGYKTVVEFHATIDPRCPCSNCRESAAVIVESAPIMTMPKGKAVKIKA